MEFNREQVIHIATNQLLINLKKRLNTLSRMVETNSAAVDTSVEAVAEKFIALYNKREFIKNELKVVQAEFEEFMKDYEVPYSVEHLLSRIGFANARQERMGKVLLTLDREAMAIVARIQNIESEVFLLDDKRAAREYIKSLMEV